MIFESILKSIYFLKSLFNPFLDHLILIFEMLWVAITDGTFIPKNAIDGVFTEKLPKCLLEVEIKKTSYD